MMWKSLQMPRSFEKVDATDNGYYAKFVIEALERGWGITLGNALRRTLLSSLQGAAIVSVKIDGVDKEFTSIQGIRSEEHTSELQSRPHLVCRLLLEKK